MTKTDIRKIYKEFHVPKHIQMHMKAVADLCENITKKLTKKGEIIDKENLILAALLHDTIRVCDIRIFKPENFPHKTSKEDITKWEELRGIYGKIGHEEAMARILESRNKEVIANLIRKHGFNKIDELKSWEEIILYYADKRVEGTKIVSLKKRFEEGRKRNTGKDTDMGKIAEYEKKVYELESKYFKELT